MMRLSHLLPAIAALGAFAVAASPALAKSARCFTTDDGYYDCRFEATAKDGSFEISAPGYPTFALVMDRPGVAWGYGIFEPGGRSVALPGRFFRSKRDGACWVNDETGVEICAW